jgi:hypothetical protein
MEVFTMKKNKWFVLGMISLVLMFGLALFACESFGGALVNSAANTYSSTSETGMVYTFYNHSSVSVTIEDSTGSVTISPGGSQQVRYNRTITIGSVQYSPTSVKVEQSGSGFFFND